MITIRLPKGMINYRIGCKDKAIRTLLLERPDRVHGLTAYWYDSEFRLLCTLVGISWDDFQKMEIVKFAECLEADDGNSDN